MDKRKIISLTALLISVISFVVAQNDDFQSVQNAARLLSRFERKAVWSIPTDARSADIIEFINEDQVLIGKIYSDELFKSPSLGTINLLNAATGEILWSVSRDKNPKINHVLLETSPDIVLSSMGSDKGKIWALDIATGRNLWSIPIGGNAQIRFNDDHSLLGILSEKKDEGTLQIIDIQKGIALWNTGIELGPNNLIVTGNMAIVVNKSAQSYDINTGEINWNKEIPELGKDPYNALLSPHGIAVWTASDIILLDTYNGNILWSQTVKKGGLKLLAANNNMLYRVIGSDDILETDFIETINATNGQILWRTDTRGLVVSPLIFQDELIIFTIEDALVGLKNNDGSQVYRMTFDDGYAMANPVSTRHGGVPDLLIPNGDLLIIDRDGTGLVAYNLFSGIKEWETPKLKGRTTISMQQTGILANLKETDKTSDFSPAKMINWFEPRPNTIISQSQQMHDQIIQHKNKVLSDSKTSSGERKDAIQAAKLSSSLEISRMETQFSMERTMAAANLSYAIITAGKAIQQLRVEMLLSKLRDRERMFLKGLIIGRETGIRGNVHLGRFKDNEGSGIRFVNLENGQTNTLRYEPIDKLHYTLTIPTEVYGLSPSGKRLIIVGLGLDADKYKPVKKLKITGVKPSILCFDPTQPKPETEDEVVEKSSAEVKLIPSTLSEAITFGNIDAVRKYLEAGEDPNQIIINEFIPDLKTTPLRLAAMDGPEIVKLLLEYGAKPATIEEVPGLTAMDIALKRLQNCLPQYTEEILEVREVLSNAGSKAQVYSYDTVMANKKEKPLKIDENAWIYNAALHIFLLRRKLNDPATGDSWKQSHILYTVYAEGNMKLFYSLLEKGANINTGNEYGNTVLHTAVFRQDVPLIKELLKLNADPNIKNNAGYTPMTSMFHPSRIIIDQFKERMIKILELLLKNGADPNTQMPAQPDGKVKSLLEIAATKDKDLAKILESYGALK